MLRALAAAALIATAPPTDLGAPVAPGYQPADKDERGLWMQVEELERQIGTSAFVVRDAALNTYVRDVLCRTIGTANCAGVRLYIVRTADFNASMFPTGMTVINTGLLLRVRNEAQLAAVLGHEWTHFARRHSLQNFRTVRTRANIAAWLSVVPVGSYAAAALLSAARLGVIGSIFRFGRAMETEADAESVPLMVRAGYDAREAPRIWEQFRAEQDATAAARHRRSRKDADNGLFADHPPSRERVEALAALAAGQPAGGTDGRAPFRAALRAWWPALIDDQIKLNDFGATDVLIARLADGGEDEGGGWTPELLYARGELYRTRGTPADLRQAETFYAQATADPAAPAEAWRGLGLVRLRAGQEDAGRAALSTYLRKKPEANDRAMIAMMAGEG